MLFPGHERSQNLLGDLGDGSDRRLSQDRLKGEKPTTGTRPLNFSSTQDNRRIQASSDSPRLHSKHDSDLAPAQIRTHTEDEWPNGVPPAGPRKLLQRARQFPSSWYSGVLGRDRFPDTRGSTLKPTRHKWPLSPKYSEATNGIETAKLLGKVVKGSSYGILDRSKSFKPAESEVKLTQATSGMKDLLPKQDQESPDLLPPSGSKVSECLPSESLSMLNHKSVPASPRAQFLVIRTLDENYMDKTIVSPKCSANKAEISDKGSVPSPLHKDVADILNRPQRSSSEAASVISATSSIAGKSSSSSVSSHLRLSICHTCKKPPFREKLKGCFECSRHYHKGCAKPKDRITEDTWVCRRCLNKLAKKSESSVASSSRLSVTGPSGSLQEPKETPASTRIPHSMLERGTGGVDSLANPPLQSALSSENVNFSKEVVDKPIHAAHHNIDLPHHNQESLTPAPYGCGSPELGTEDTNKETSKSSANNSTINLPSYFHGWKAKLPGAAAKTDTVDEFTDFVPSSSAAAPSFADPGLKPPEKILNRHSSFDDPQGQDIDNQSLSRGKTLATKQPLMGNVSAGLLGSTKAPTQDNQKLSYELLSGAQSVGTSEAQKVQDRVLMIDSAATELRRASTTSAQSKDISAQISKGVELSSPMDAERSIGESVQPVKKLCSLCSQCHKPILGSALMCMKCRRASDSESTFRSEEVHSNGHPSMLYSPKTPNAVPPNSPFWSTPVEGSPAEKPNIGQGLARNLSTCDTTGQDSLCVPETPELAFGRQSKSAFIACDDKASSPANTQRLPRQLVPQKRPPAHSLQLENEHCFAKKPKRTFKPTAALRGANGPGLRLNNFQHGQASSPPRIENNMRDASVQTSFETVHRGTSPSCNPRAITHKSHSPARGIDSPGNGLSEATFHKGKISFGDNAPHETKSFSPYSAIKSKKQRVLNADRTVFEQQVKDVTQKAQKFEEAEAATARIQKLMQRGNKPLRPGLSVLEEKPGNMEDDGKNVDQPGTKPNDGPGESAYNWTSDDEQALLSKLRKKGVMFEEGLSPESESESTVQASPSKPPPKDPLWRRPTSSTDLFTIAPHLRPNHHAFDVEQKRKEIAARPSRKARRLNMPYLRQERGENIHEEVERTFPPRLLKVSAVEHLELGNLVEGGTNGTGNEQRVEKEMTFSEFVGAPAKPMVILTKDKQLAFRDGTRDSKGELPRAREKFVVTNKSVACMEH